MKKSTIAAIQYLEATIARGLLSFFLNPQVYGSENLQKLNQLHQEHACSTIIISNHINAYDPIYLSATLAAYLGRQLYPVWLPAKKRFFSNSFKSRIMYAHGCLPLGIGKDEDSLRSMKAIIEKVRAGDNICVFPEGQVSTDGNMGKDLGFVTFLARRSKVLLLPVCLSGILGFRAEWIPVLLRKRQLTVAFGPPVLLEQGTVLDSMSLIRSAGSHEKYQLDL